MGVGVSWDKLAGTVSKEGAFGIISAAGTGYYKNQIFIEKSIDNRPLGANNLHNREALFEIFKNARKICGDKPLGCNVLYATNNYGQIVRDACKAGADVIITGAGLPINLPEFTKDFPNVALIPLVSSVKALNILCRRWIKKYNKLPDAIIVEGPLSGGHQGFTFEQCHDEQYRLENLIQPIKEEIKKWGVFPLIAAGGIWDKNDIDKLIQLGADGVQMGTRFMATHECDIDDNFKRLLIEAKEDDIELVKSPVGYLARVIKSNLIQAIKNNQAPKIKCISNCVFPCNQGTEAKEVGFCIADRLSDAHFGIEETGLFFIGTNGYKINEIISVKELLYKLFYGESK
ncbi:nitronate monooxygenase [Sulfurovum sp. CS9]|uniref:nitronate monooxygenase n=1 Tax=Sulfurovum sp. CS9 TaxID=3391146 RepID=UPI0039E9E4EA